MSRGVQRQWWQRLRGLAPAPAATVDGEEKLAFTCNLCGAANRVARTRLERETPSCAHCGSTVRWRALVQLVCESLGAGAAAIPDLPPRRDLRGLGLSDDECVARALASRFDYTNTFFDAEPRLDIAAVPAHMHGRYDFLCASDVFEHVAPPVHLAFANARRLLRRGGVFVFTAPFSLEADTIEHFPELYAYSLSNKGGRWRLHNRTRDGHEQVFEELVFHGGPGATLEMRLFSRAGLERQFAEAGFREVRFAGESCERFGIVWPHPWSLPIVASA
jgi:SAM-dependent methyltransferase